MTIFDSTMRENFIPIRNNKMAVGHKEIRKFIYYRTDEKVMQ